MNGKRKEHIWVGQIRYHCGASMGCLVEMKRVFCMLLTDTGWMVLHADEFHSAYYGSSSQSLLLQAWDF